MTTKEQQKEFSTRKATVERLLKSTREELAHMLSCTENTQAKIVLRQTIGDLRATFQTIDGVEP